MFGVGMIDDSGITVKLNLPYRSQKMIKKMYGKNLSFEIAIGRKMVKMLQDKYTHKPGVISD